MKLTLFSFLITGLLLLTSCSKQEDAASTSLPSCKTDSVTSKDCLITTTGLYYYNLPYGGRSTTITGTLTAPVDSLTFSLPTGWYSNSVTVNFSSSTLSGANANQIRSGINLFGVTGTFASTANPACDLTAPNGLQSSACSASTGNFLFNMVYGGRGTNCANYDNNMTNSTCWVATPGYVLDNTVSSNPANCSVEGSQAATCTGPVGTYFYNADSGGRTANCVSGFNSAACWVSATGKLVTNSTSACVENSYNPGTCNTNPGRYVYPTIYGGRNTTCVNDLAGSCFVTQPSKAALEPALISDNLKLGVSVFGVTGFFAGAGDWYSGMHRSQDTSPFTQAAESGYYNGSGPTPTLPAGYRMVSSIIRDDEGFSSTEVSYVDRTGWNALTCGTTQNTLVARISDCNNVFGANATWDGSVKGNASHSRWKLVTRTGNLTLGKGREVWFDEKTTLIWSSLISKSTNWCKAVGSSNNVGVVARYREIDPMGICNADAYQNNTAGSVLSACFEEAGFSNTDPEIDNAGKGGLSLTASVNSPAVAWRAPTFYDYEVADSHGIRFVLPDMGKNTVGDEWVATIFSNDKNKAWTYFGDTGIQSSKFRNQKALIRCIGR